MYKLIVKEELYLGEEKMKKHKISLENFKGWHFVPGHDADGLSRVEATELLTKFPERFEPGNEITKELAKLLSK